MTTSSMASEDQNLMFEEAYNPDGDYKESYDYLGIQTPTVQVKCEKTEIKEEILEFDSASSSNWMDNETYEEDSQLLKLEELKEAQLECAGCVVGCQCTICNKDKSYSSCKEQSMNAKLNLYSKKEDCKDRNVIWVSERKSYKCPLCGRSLSSKPKLNRHIARIHEKYKQLKCSNCEYVTRQKSDLACHTIAVHEKLIPLKCLNCKYICSRKSDLSNHYIAVHQKLKRFKCNDCVYASSDKSNLRRHIRLKHKKLNEFTYTTYHQKSNLINCTRAVHIDLEKFKCNLCKYTSRDKSNLEKHIENHHEYASQAQYMCLECDYTCHQKSELLIHERAFHEYLFPLKCTECEFTTGEKSNLERHIKDVHSVNLFSCSECEYVCNLKASLRVHVMEFHRKFKVVKCPKCEYKCSRNFNLIRHLKSVHEKK